jgi:hypothetical protein
LKGEDNGFPYPVYFPSRPHDLGRDIIGRLPDGALLVTKWQNVYPCYYVAIFEDNKPNIEVIERLSYGEKVGMAQTLIDYLQRTCGTRPTYITGITPNILHSFQYEPIPGRFPLYRMHPNPPQ